MREIRAIRYFWPRRIYQTKRERGTSRRRIADALRLD
jgi:hypothetical protein